MQELVFNIQFQYDSPLNLFKRGKGCIDDSFCLWQRILQYLFGECKAKTLVFTQFQFSFFPFARPSQVMTTALSGHRTNQQATTKTVHPKIVQIYFLKEARSQSHEHVGTKLYYHSNVYKISEAFRPMFAVGVAHQSPNHLPEVHIAILLGAELLQNASACVSKRNVLTKGPVKPHPGQWPATCALGQAAALRSRPRACHGRG